MRHFAERLIDAADMPHLGLPHVLLAAGAHEIESRAERQNTRHILRAALEVFRHVPRLFELHGQRARAALNQAFELLPLPGDQHAGAHRAVKPLVAGTA